MSQRRHTFVPGEFYHIYNRGTDKRAIFLDAHDYQRFQILLHVCNNTQNVNIRNLRRDKEDLFNQSIENRLVAIGAYCLMPNHYHLLLTPVSEEAVSHFLQKLSTSYSMYFNKKYERTGTLFEGKFKSQLANEDKYLKYLFSYIHLNPIKLIQSDWKVIGIKDTPKAIEYLNNYNYSSYKEWQGSERPEKIILNKQPFPEYYESLEQAQKEIREWLTFA